MREIKFRYWDGRKFLFNVQDYFDPASSFACFGDLLKEDGAIIEQYTGLKDKNGREIYEGDVLSATVNGNEKPEIVECKWQGTGFWLISGDGWLYMPQTEYMEVIGNIHENPELLK